VIDPLTRREFIALSAQAVSLCAAGHLPLLAADASGTGAPLATDAVEPIDGYLSSFRPVKPQAKLPNTLEYAMVMWQGRDVKGTGKTRNGIRGSARVRRAERADAVEYEVRLRHSAEPAERVTKYECSRNELGTLKAFRSYHRSQKGLKERSTDTGQFTGKQLRLSGTSRPWTIEEPLLDAWFIPFLLMRKQLPNAIRVTCVSEGTAVLLHQWINKRSGAKIPIADGEVLPMQVWSRHGPGTLPVHYLLDESGLPQLMTAGIMSWALKSVG